MAINVGPGPGPREVPGGPVSSPPVCIISVVNRQVRRRYCTLGKCSPPVEGMGGAYRPPPDAKDNSMQTGVTMILAVMEQ